MYHIYRFMFVGSLALFLAGCGGEEEATESAATDAPKQTAVTPKTVAGNAAPKPVGGAPSRSKPSTSRKRNAEPANSALPPGVEPDDVFITDAGQNTFELSATPQERATFTIVNKPADGTDSRTFAWSTPRKQSPGGRSSASFQPPRIAVTTGRPAAGVGRRIEGLPEGFVAAKGSEKHESGLPLRIRNTTDDSEFLLIPAGNTIRGSKSGPANTQPEHQVYLDSYYIAVHEVTLRQWKLYKAAERENDRLRQPAAPLNEGERPDLPALGIPQLDARKYAEWLKADLPTEAQWEKAARGPLGFLYPWGDGRPIWSRHRDKQEILPVMSWRNDISTYGVYDLAGNAREWTFDVYRDDWYAQVAGERGEKLVDNPTGPKPGAGAYDRVIRGGGDDWKVWHRESARFTEQIPDVGFRLVVIPKPTEEQATEETKETPRTRPNPRGGF